MSSFSEQGIAFDVHIQWRDAAGVISTEYFSTVPRTGAAGDPSFAGPIAGRVKQIALEQFMYGDLRTRGPRQIHTGSIVLHNGDGALDGWISRSVYRCWVKVLRVNLSDLAASTEFIGVSESVEASESTVTFMIRDFSFIFDKVALPTQYLGNNVLPAGVEGTSELRGVRKPRVVGYINLIPAICVNTSKLIYQLDGYYGINPSAPSGLTVYDKGVALAYSGVDHPTQAALEAAVVAAGQYDKYASGGMVKLGAKPQGQLTCTMKNTYNTGTITPAPATTDPEFHSMMAWVAQMANPAGASVNASTIPTNPSGWRAIVGVYASEEMTYLEIMDLLAASATVSWDIAAGSGLDIAITCRRLVDPSTVTVTTLPLTQSSFIGRGDEGLRRVMPSDDDRGIPVWRVTLKGYRNYIVENASELAAAVTSAEVERRGKEWGTAVSSDASVKTQYPDAPEIVIETSLVDMSNTPAGADSQGEADRLLALYKVRRDMLQGELLIPKVGSSSPYPALGEVVTIQHNRYGLSAGKKFAVIGRRLDVERGVCTFTFWG